MASGVGKNARVWIFPIGSHFTTLFSPKHNSVLFFFFFCPMSHSMPGLPVYHQLPESTQTHVHWVGDAIQPSHFSVILLPSIFPGIKIFSNEPALHIRWPKYWSSASISVLPMNTQDWSPSGWTGWISLQSKGLSRVFSNTAVQKHQFFSAQLSSQSTYVITGKTIALTRQTF